MRLSLFLILIFVSWMVSTTAQTQINIDSLQNQSKKLIYIDQEKSLKISDYIVQNADNDLTKFKELLTKSHNYFLQKNYILSLEQIKLLNSLEIKNDFWQLKKQLLLVEILDSLDLDLKSKELLFNSKKLIQKIKDPRQKKEGEFHVRLLNYNNTFELKNLEKEIENAQFNNKTYFLNKVYSGLAFSYLEKNELDSAFIYYSKINSGNSLPYFHSVSQLGKAKIFSKQNKIDESNEILQSLITSETKIKNLFLSKIHRQFAQNYFKKEDLNQYSYFNDLYLKNFDKEFENKQKARLRIIDLLEFEKTKNHSDSLNFYWKIIYGIGIFLFLVLVFFIFKLIKIQQNNNRKVQEQKNKDWLESSKKEMEAKWLEEKNIPFIIPEKTELVILEKLKKFEIEKQFLNPELSLNSLAKEFNTNTSYLSEIINKHIGKNFKTYINELRIRHITKLMQENPEYLSYKISYLASEAGFISRTSFTTIFKSVTGISPSVFIESLQQNNKE